MKTQRNIIQLFLLIAIGVIAFFAYSCQKEDPIITWSDPLKQMVNIPSGTFTMGSSSTEGSSDEIEHQVTLSAFKMSKYEITNAQYAVFLNAKNIGSNGLYAAGTYPTKSLVNASYEPFDWGLHYKDLQWVPVAGYENHPVILVSWYGATEFATYIGGTLPTEAQWEYACRGNTTTPFNTGTCLSNAQANYNWGSPYNNCTNTILEYPRTTQAVGSYPANAYGLHDMHGNLSEWCSDYYDDYSTTPQTNPTGPTVSTLGSLRVIRGGYWGNPAYECRSAIRNYNFPDSWGNCEVGFRVVLVP